MGYYCTVPQCTSLAGKTKNVKFHRFPRDVTMADKWNLILKRGKPYTKYSKVCSLHFTQADYNVTTMGQWKTLSKDAVPSQNLPKLNPDGTVMVIRKSRTVKYREGKKDDSATQNSETQGPARHNLISPDISLTTLIINRLAADGTSKAVVPTQTDTRRVSPTTSDKPDKSWQSAMVAHSALPLMASAPETNMGSPDMHDNSILAYRLQTLGAIANNISPQLSLPHNGSKPKKQDAIMQTDPVQNEDDDTQPNNSYSEVSDKSYSSEVDQYNQSYPKDTYPKDTSPYPKETPQYSREQTPYTKEYAKEPTPYKESIPYKEPTPYQRESPYKDTSYPREPTPYKDTVYPKDDTYTKAYESKSYEPKDYRKSSEDYIPQTNEEYNKEAEKYALERKSHNGYDLKDYQKQGLENGYPKLPVTDMYSFDKFNRDMYYQNGYADSAEVLRNQQHNLQILQEQHRITENQNFFNENHIKQEIDISVDDDKFMYERSKEQLESSPMYAERQRLQHQRILEHIQHQVKQEPDTPNGCENVMQPQGSPYYPPNGHNNVGAYYEALPRPGAELLIAKQNALAAHTQLWQNSMKRPFFYSESPHYNGPQLLHRYDDIPRILQ